jgi:NAD(P)H-nitrite reductase large subunit
VYIDVHTGVRAVEIGEAGGDRTVRLSDGTTLRADLVVMAIGVRPNVELARAGGLRVARGIVVDHHLRTSAPDVYAAGDCAEGPDLSTGGLDVHAIQPTAVEHGRVAGANMAGQAIRYDGSLAMNILDVVGLQCASFGRWRDGDGAVTATENPGRPLYRKLLWAGDRLAGAILRGPAEDVALLNDLGMVKGLIQSRAALGPWAEELRRSPMDVRRAYVGAGGPAALLARTLLGRALPEQRHRYVVSAATPTGPDRAAEGPRQLKLDPARGKGGAA